MLRVGLKYTAVPLILYKCGKPKLVVVTESFILRSVLNRYHFDDIRLQIK